MHLQRPPPRLCRMGSCGPSARAHPHRTPVILYRWRSRGPSAGVQLRRKSVNLRFALSFKQWARREPELWMTSLPCFLHTKMLKIEITGIMYRTDEGLHFKFYTENFQARDNAQIGQSFEIMYNIVKIYVFKIHSSDTTKQGSALLCINIYKLFRDLAHIHNILVISEAPQRGPNYWINGIMCNQECIPLLRCTVKRPSVICPLKSPREWCQSKISK